MRPRGVVGGVALVLATLVVSATLSVAHQSKDGGRLAKIGPAPAFTLATTAGGKLSLADLRGLVVAVTFIYASCADTCPLLIAKLIGLQPKLGADLGTKVFFVAVTVDPERDTPSVLKRYAQSHGAKPVGWSFLTGTTGEIREVAGRYGVYLKRGERGDVDHTFLTSVIDTRGVLRVQYLGVRFDPDELLRDVRSLLR